MAEYNMQYRDLKKRLKVLKLLNETNYSIEISERDRKNNVLESLLKNLDYKHSEELPLTDIEQDVIDIEENKA